MTNTTPTKDKELKPVIKSRARKGGITGEQQKANYRELYNLLYSKVNLKKLTKKIESGKYRAVDYFYYELLTSTGKESRQTVFKKLYPDSVIQDINLSGEFEGIKLDR